MYSNLLLKNGEKESSDEEEEDDLNGFVKFLLVGDLQKKAENEVSSEEDVAMRRMSQEEMTPRRLPVLSRFDQS